MVWSGDGFLLNFGIKDFAGGTVVHMSAGFAVLGRCFDDWKKKKKMTTMNLPILRM